MLRQASISVPHWIIDAKADKLAERQIEVQALHHLPLRADAVEQLQKQHPRQFLLRNRRPADGRVDRFELPSCRERIVYDHPDRSQWMARRRALLEIDKGKQIF